VHAERGGQRRFPNATFAGDNEKTTIQKVVKGHRAMISDRVSLIRRTAFAAVGLFGLLGLWGGPALSQSDTVEFIDVTGVIDPVTARFVERQIDRASEVDARLLIIRLDTPGGLDSSMREIVKSILNAPLPVVVWVAPPGARAASAGVFITYASHVAAMAPGTNLGAAHPVNLGGGESDDVTTEKVTNDAVEYLTGIAKLRGRDVDFAENAVRESASMDSEKALAAGVVEIITPSLNQLLSELNGRSVELEGSTEVTIRAEGAQVVFHKMSLLERLLHVVVNPEIAFFLIIFGFYGLIFELYNPGIGAAGILGGISLILGFYALSVLPTSWAALALILLGVAFFAIDLHTAGLGVFTIGGTVALIAGALLLFAGADPEFRIAWWAIAGVVVSTLLFFLGIMTAAIRARLAKPVSGAEGLIGTIAVARTDIAPEGQVFARGTLWRARTAGVAVGEGDKVKIIGVVGLTLMVEEAKASDLAEEATTTKS
jgi:membrane-bound serine protease (ClpP class)